MNLSNINFKPLANSKDLPVKDIIINIKFSMITKKVVLLFFGQFELGRRLLTKLIIKMGDIYFKDCVLPLDLCIDI